MIFLLLASQALSRPILLWWKEWAKDLGQHFPRDAFARVDSIQANVPLSRLLAEQLAAIRHSLGPLGFGHLPLHRLANSIRFTMLIHGEQTARSSNRDNHETRTI